jgi:Mg/Co/Ni transporter MgtE
MNNYQITATKQRLDLLTEIEQTPEEHISDLLKIVRLFRQSILIKQTSINAWDQAINQINNSELNQQKQEKIKQLFQSWSELDDETDQKETLKIIESLEGVSI